MPGDYEKGQGGQGGSKLKEKVEGWALSEEAFPDVSVPEGRTKIWALIHQDPDKVPQPREEEEEGWALSWVVFPGVLVVVRLCEEVWMVLMRMRAQTLQGLDRDPHHHLCH